MFSLRRIIGRVIVAVFFTHLTGCTEFAPPWVSWDKNQPVVGPTSPGPQGILLVYSESYEGEEEEELPTSYRRPIFLYTGEGQFMETFNDPPLDNEPVRVVIPPGNYIVVSKAQHQLRKIQVEVYDGLTTAVSESQLAHASFIPPS